MDKRLFISCEISLLEIMVGARCEPSARAYFDGKKGRGLLANILSK